MMKRFYLLGAAFLVLLVVAITTPSEERHERHIIEQYKEQNPITGALGVGEALAALCTYHNNVFYSTMYLGDDRISMGFISQVNVRTLDLDELPDWIIEQLPDDLRRRQR